MDALKGFFLFILNMSITATYVALAILIVRILFLKKLPKIYSYTIWAILLFRLCCPISFSSNFSVFNFIKPDNNGNSAYMEYIPKNIDFMQTPAVDVGTTSVNNLVNTSLPKATQVASINPMQVITFIATIIWLAGILALVLYSIISYLKVISNTKFTTIFTSNVTDDVIDKIKLKRKVKIFQSTQIKSPFVCGFIEPKIYIPNNLPEKELSYILNHELIHIKRFDYLIKPFAYIILVLHWFNPILWISFSLMSKDMEMSCDERVLSILGNDIKKDYSNSLLSLAVKNNKILQGSPLAFGESNVKSRIKNVLKFKKLSSFLTVAVISLLAILGYILMANPASLNMDKNFSPKSIEIDLVGDMQNIAFTEEESLKITELLQYDKWEKSKMEYDLSTMTYISNKTVKEAINGESQKVIGLYEDVDGYTFIKLYSGFGLKDGNYYRTPVEVYSDIEDYLGTQYFVPEEDISPQFDAKSDKSKSPSNSDPIAEIIFITTDEKELTKIGEMLFATKLKTFMNENVDDADEIVSYTIKDSKYLAGTVDEFAISIEYDLIPKVENSNWQAGNGITNAYRELRIKRTSKKTYQLISFGTGGAAVGLPYLFNASRLGSSIILRDNLYNSKELLYFNDEINSEEDLIATKVFVDILNNTTKEEKIHLSPELVGYSIWFKIDGDSSNQYLLGNRTNIDYDNEKIYCDIFCIDKDNLSQISILQSYVQDFTAQGTLPTIIDFSIALVKNHIIYEDVDGYWKVQDVSTKEIYSSYENNDKTTEIEQYYSDTDEYITILKYKEDNSYLIFDKASKKFKRESL